MKPIFQKEDAQRPDPYLDWEFRTRSGLSRGAEPPKDQWCSLYIKVRGASAEDRLANMKQLEQAVRIGRLPEDRVEPPDRLTIRMADDERAHLRNLIANGARIQPDIDQVLLQFFVYRLEPLIYKGGRYVSTELYDVILAGPPIADLHFEPLDDKAIQPITFDDLPDIATRGVAIGVIDDGIGFAHERFRSDPVKSRVMAIWLQDVERAENGPADKKGRRDPRIAFGRCLDNTEINELLKRHENEADIYRELGLIDFGKNAYNPLALRATHGTHVLDVAAGYDPVGQPRLRPILAVQLPSIATLDTSGVTMGSYVVQAVRQIMLWADKLGTDVPLVINFSYGLSAGPKDGTHPIEVALNELISHRNRRASTCLVVPAGNTYRARTTARMKLVEGKPISLDWMILPDDPTPNFLEIWLDNGSDPDERSPIEVTLAPPDGLPSDAARPDKGELKTLKLDKKSIAATYYDVSNDKRGRIFVAVNQTATMNGRADCAPAGRWRLTLENKSKHEVTAHLYIQRDSTPFGYRGLRRQSYFDDPHAYCRDEVTGNYDDYDPEKCPITRSETLSALATLPPGNGKRIFVVGAAQGMSGFVPPEASAPFVPAPYTSSGPTTERKGPDCAAVTEEGPAHSGVLAAGTFSGSIVKMSGTSVAAPQLVRWIANHFEQNRVAALLPDKGTVPPPASQRVPSPAAMGVSDQDAFPAVKEQAARLGRFVIQRRPDRHVPRRRYPVETISDPDDEITN